LERLRKACAELPNVEEILSFGNPAFKVRGKAFAVLDQYGGRDCLWLWVGLADRDDLLTTSGWFASPYDPRAGALFQGLDGADWRKIRSLVRSSYQLALVAKVVVDFHGIE
jgi:predicted DNA-binding protein (MmcQ/YjbR family)